MARKKSVAPDIENANMSIDDLFAQLTNDGDFVIADIGSLMSNCPKVSTPLKVIDCIYGGGLPLSVMTEISGPPASGKSTFSYQTLGNYQREFPDGVPVIYDMEASMDASRLQVLGVDTHRLLRKKADTIENAFASLFKVLNALAKQSETNPNITTFQVYDSLSAGGTEKQHERVASGENVFNAGSMMEAPRIIKQNLANVMPYFDKIPMFIGLINQVFMQGIGTYVPKAESGGGFGLKHLCHAHIKFDKGQEVVENNFIVGSLSYVNLEKSKLSPKFIRIPCYIDVTNGGKIDEVESFIRYLSDDKVNLIQAGAWYKLDTIIDSMSARYTELIDMSSAECDVIEPLKTIKNKSYRKNDLYNLVKTDKNLFMFLEIALIDFIDGIYKDQRVVNGNFQKQLMVDCDYFPKNGASLYGDDTDSTEDVLTADVEDNTSNFYDDFDE